MSTWAPRLPYTSRQSRAAAAIRIKGADGIYNVSTSGLRLSKVGRTILEGAALGGIGTAETPLTVALAETVPP